MLLLGDCDGIFVVVSVVWMVARILRSTDFLEISLHFCKTQKNKTKKTCRNHCSFQLMNSRGSKTQTTFIPDG